MPLPRLTVLLKTLALLVCLHAPATGVNAAEENYFGPEVEFMGKRMRLGILCTGAGNVLPGLFPESLSTQALESLAEKQIESSLTKPFFLSHIALVGAGISSAVGYTLYQELPEDSYPGVAASGATIALLGGTAAGTIHLALARCKGNIQSSFNEYTGSYDDAIEAQLKKRCEDGHCVLKRIESTSYGAKRNFELTFPDRPHLVITITHDPNVIEVKMNRMTSSQYEEARSTIQEDLYEPLRKAGVKPPKIDGPWNGGHIHIDLKAAFDDDPRLFGNFLKDLVNHEGMFQGPLGWDPFGGALISDSDQKLAEFQAILAKLEAFEKAGEKINWKKIAHYPPFDKRTGINIQSIGTLELRGFRSQGSAEVLALNTRLLDRRIRYIRSLGREALPFTVTGPVKRNLLQRAADFRDYVVGMGESWEEFKELAPLRYRLLPAALLPERGSCAKAFEMLSQEAPDGP